MRRTRGTSAPAIVETARALPGGAPAPEDVERRRRVVSEMRRVRDEVVGPVEVTIAQLLAEEDGGPARR